MVCTLLYDTRRKVSYRANCIIKFKNQHFRIHKEKNKAQGKGYVSFSEKGLQYAQMLLFVRKARNLASPSFLKKWLREKMFHTRKG